MNAGIKTRKTKKKFHKRMIKLTLFIVIALGIYFYFKPKYHPPKLNPHPKYFLTIQGTIAPEFKNKGHLVFMATYSASKDPCFHEGNILAGTEEAEGRTHYYWIKTDKNNHYKIRIPIDKYLPGICDWIPYTVAMDFVKNKKDANQFVFASINNELSQKYNPSYVDLYYSLPKLDLIDLKLQKYKDSTLTLHDKQSYSVTVNILYKKI